MLYIDTSALVKLVIEEPESDALRKYLAERETPMSSALAVVELIRTVRRVGEDLAEDASRLADNVVLLDVDREVLDRAAMISPAEVRSLDAIHLASAQVAGAELEAIVTYDRRMAKAAQDAGLAVSSPS